jgi:hypothetical protein
VLDLPTNEAWIDPWVAHLRRLGVKFRFAEVEQLELRRGRIASARVRSVRGGERSRVEADWFVLAVPVERARRLMRGAITAADPRLEGLRKLETRWMNGIQFFMRRPVPVVRGHVLHIDSPWALASISQAQFWERRSFPRDYGDGTVRDCISVDIGAFDEPGIVFGKPARALGPGRIARETWEQMKAHLNDRGQRVLRDEDVARWSLDPGLVYRRGRGPGPVNQDPLYISTPGTWDDRPDAATGVPNLLLAADYVKVGIDTASMEGACDAGRRAANAILAKADSPASPARVYSLYRAPEWDPYRAADARAYALGLPNPIGLPAPPG